MYMDACIAYTVRKSPRTKIENGFSKRNFPARKWSACTARRPYVFALVDVYILNINKNNPIRPLPSIAATLPTIESNDFMHNSRVTITQLRVTKKNGKKLQISETIENPSSAIS